MTFTNALHKKTNHPELGSEMGSEFTGMKTTSTNSKGQITSAQSQGSPSWRFNAARVNDIH